MYGPQRFKAYLHVEHVMRTVGRPLLKLPAVAFMMPIQSTSSILARRREKI